MSAIDRKLKRDPTFNPFNDSFDYDIVKKEVRKYQENGEVCDTRIVETALSTSVFNEYYKQYYRLAEKTVLELKTSKDALVRYFFAAANRDLCGIDAELEKKMREVSDLGFEDISGLRIESPVKAFGQVDPFAMIDISVDILNVVLNYLRYHEMSGRNVASRIDKELKSAVISLYRATNIFRLVKEAYETAIWEEGYVELRGQDRDIYVGYCNEMYPIILQVGLMRLQRNVFMYSLNIQREPEMLQSLINGSVMSHK